MAKPHLERWSHSEAETREFMLHRGKPTMNWFFPRRSMWPIDQIKFKDWFQLRISAVEPQGELGPMQNGFEIRL